MARLFGTDGVRGIANRDLTPELAMKIGEALAAVLRRENAGTPAVILGRDTRASGEMLESAVAAGLCSGGADVRTLGVLTTPAVAYLTYTLRAQAGVMITASHNPCEFNGIKIFGPKGFKLTDAEEKQIEAMVLDGAPVPAEPEEIGRRTESPDALRLYIDYLVSTVRPLGGVKVLADCAHGGATAAAGAVFAAAGADADLINTSPDGKNINRGCGSTHIEGLAEMVKAGGYDLGVAFDGDADRCLAVDEKGNVVDGDQLLAVIGSDMKARGALHESAIAVTVMSNFGFFRFAEANGISASVTQVGDRHVLERMLEKGYNLGGENSGHLIFTDFMTTGDGLLTALQLMATLRRAGRPLSELAAAMTVAPQVMVNVPATPEMKRKLTDSEEIKELIRACETKLAGRGRVLIRPSGTEPLIRVMAEGDDAGEIGRMADSLAEAIGKDLE